MASHYDILGVSPQATKEDIKKAYRQLQFRHHPDKNNSSQESIEMTQKINMAYETLGDEQKRQEYDFSLQGGGQHPQHPFFFHHQGGGPPQGMDDFLQMFFGGPFGGMMPPGGARIHVVNRGGGGLPGGFQTFHEAMQKPPPIMRNLEVTMDQVLTGATVPIEVERWETTASSGGMMREKVVETIYVTVPQGVDDNEIIVLRDKGNALSETVRGDVKLVVKVINNTSFKRNGLDLILEKKIQLKEALCGFTFEIKHLNEKSYTLNSNRGHIVVPDHKKVYPGMGLVREEHKGNLVIHFHVEFPEKLTEEQIQGLQSIL